jgi:hypothetical protein
MKKGPRKPGGGGEGGREGGGFCMEILTRSGTTNKTVSNGLVGT